MRYGIESWPYHKSGMKRLREAREWVSREDLHAEREAQRLRDEEVPHAVYPLGKDAKITKGFYWNPNTKQYNQEGA